MFIVNLTYKVDISKIDEHIETHRCWLDSLYKINKILCSGPKNPRDGGVIIILGDAKMEVEGIIQQDPFYIYVNFSFTVKLVRGP